jgi:hypothetical protein
MFEVLRPSPRHIDCPRTGAALACTIVIVLFYAGVTALAWWAW